MEQTPLDREQAPAGAALLPSERSPGPIWFEPAWAKVNLYLHVVGRRPDGYHLLDSVAVFPAVGDLIMASHAADLSLAIDGPFAGPLSDQPDNFVLRAARALAGARDVSGGAALRLIKRLPVASGIGGGSADAAAALRLLARLWRVDPADLALALPLGADVPVCLDSRATRMGGIGEQLAAAPGLPDCGMVLINPGVAVSTPAVFRARHPRFSPLAALPAAWADFADLVGGLAMLGNDLESAARQLCPVIDDVLAALRHHPDCALARMSGSGATCYGLFTTPAAAAAAAGALARPDWWCWGGAMAGFAEPGLAQNGAAT